MSADAIAVLRIELIDIEPLIWRRVAVKTATNLQTLHRIIQPVMGWLDYHLARSGYVLTYVYVCVGCRFLPPRGHLPAGSKLSHTCFGRFREP